MDALLLRKDNTNLLRVKRVKNKLTGDPITAPTTATVTLTNRHGQEIGGETWPKALTEDGTVPAAEQGTFYANLSPNLLVKVGELLTATITIDAGSGLVFSSSPRVRVIERTD